MQVDDFQQWYAEYEAMHSVREAHGERGRRLLCNPQDRNSVVVVFEWDSLDRARSYFESEVLSSSVARAGAQRLPEVLYLESV